MNYEGKEGINTRAPQGFIFILFVAGNLLRKRLISEASIYFCPKYVDTQGDYFGIFTIRVVYYVTSLNSRFTFY